MPTFEPPTVDDLVAVRADTQGPAYDLFKHYTYTRGLSVVRRDDHWVTTTTPLYNDLPQFIGGHIYDVDYATAAELIADGFTVLNDTYPGPLTYPGPTTFPG